MKVEGNTITAIQNDTLVPLDYRHKINRKNVDLADYDSVEFNAWAEVDGAGELACPITALITDGAFDVQPTNTALGVDVTSQTFVQPEHVLEQGDEIRFTDDTNLPSEFTTTDRYVVRTVRDGSFKLTNQSGKEVTFTAPDNIGTIPYVIIGQALYYFDPADVATLGTYKANIVLTKDTNTETRPGDASNYDFLVVKDGCD